jgi:hypothetical protein
MLACISIFVTKFVPASRGVFFSAITRTTVVGAFQSPWAATTMSQVHLKADVGSAHVDFAF